MTDTIQKLWQMKRTVIEANEVMRNADSVAASIAELLVGRLRHCDSSDLIAFKKELKNFNIHTRTWRN